MTVVYQPLAPAVIHAVLDKADLKLAEIVAASTDHAARNQVFAAWLQTQPEFASAGVSDDDSVWGMLTNGHLYVASTAFRPGETVPPPTPIKPRRYPLVEPTLANRPMLPMQNQAPRSLENGLRNTSDSAPVTLPTGAQARVLLSIDPTYFNTPNSDLANMLRDRNYTVIQQSATIENLKQVQGDSAFFWAAHGSISVNPVTHKAYWSVWTADDVTDERNLTYKGDLDDHSLVYFAATYKQDANGNNLVKTRYAITTNFLGKYGWTFADNAFLFMDSCHSDNGSIVLDMASYGTNPGVTMGWSGAVEVEAAWKAARFVFDRLLGANVQAPKEPQPQRPFDANETYYSLKERGLDNGGAPTRLITRSAKSVALAPSIQRMEMGERLGESPLHGTTRLTLYGIFGDDKDTVKVGGVEVPITSWAADKVVVEPADLPGPGFAGDVQVISKARTSNQVPLTQWHGTVKYAIDFLPHVANGTQISTATSHIDCDVYLRADVHKYRDYAGRAVQQPKPAKFRASQGSKCHWHVEGDAISVPQATSVWTAPITGELPFGLNGNAGAYGTGYIFSGVLDPDSETVNMSFAYLGCNTAYVVPPSPQESKAFTLADTSITATGSGVDNTDGYVIYSNNLPATIGEDMVIPGKTVNGTLQTALRANIVWSDLVPNYPPDDSKGEDDAAP